MNMLVERSRRFGGPPFAQCLEEFTKELNSKILPLTSALLGDFLKSNEYRPKHLLPFYIRMIGWTSPGISIWPVGQTPAAYRQPAHERIILRLKEWFKKKREPMKFVEAYHGIQEGGFQCTPFQFLEAVRFAAEFEIKLSDPNVPMISPPVEAPRRWARS